MPADSIPGKETQAMVLGWRVKPPSDVEDLTPNERKQAE